MKTYLTQPIRYGLLAAVLLPLLALSSLSAFGIDLPVGDGFILSRNADFSTDDRTFSDSDTLYMLLWSDQLDILSMKKAEWEVKDAAKKKVRQNLSNNGDGSFTASFDLANLPSSATSWTWKGKLEDLNRNKFQPSTTITVQ